MRLRKELKRVTALCAVALMVITALIVPCSAKDWTLYPTAKDGQPMSINDVIDKYGDVYIRIDFEGYCLENEEVFFVDVTDNEEEYWINVYGDVEAKASELFETLVDIGSQFDKSKIEHLNSVPLNFLSYAENDVITVYIMEGSSMSSLVSGMFSGFGDTISGLANGVKTMFTSILWQNGTADSGVSAFAIFGFVMAGLSLALGLGYFIIRKIRG